MAAADRAIADAFASAGWPAEVRPFEVRDVDAFADFGDFMTLVHHERLAGANVVAAREGERDRAAVLVLAHHDTVRDTPGADDNTASVVALLEVARLLGDRRFARTVVLAAVDMEELGMFGSTELVRRTLAERPVAGAIVFETMAYTSRERGSQALPPGLGTLYRGQVRRIRSRGSVGDFTNVMYRGHSAALARAFGRALAHLAGGPDAVVLLRDPLDLPAIGPLLGRVVPFVRHFARSDHKPFWEAGLPAILVNDTANFRNPNYHTPNDTPGTLDYERLCDVAAATALTVETLAGAIDAGPEPGSAR
jgi:Zn-dependent M28 family amino/carboxypeptidase